MTGPEEFTAQPDIAALAIAEQRYRALVRATSSLVWTTSADGQIIDMPEWRTYTGQSTEQIKAGAGSTHCILMIASAPLLSGSRP